MRRGLVKANACTAKPRSFSVSRRYNRLEYTLKEAISPVELKSPSMFASSPPVVRSMPRSPTRVALALAQPLLYRPLFWACLSALLGVALGGWVAGNWNKMAREDAPLGWFLLPMVGGLAFALVFRRFAWRSRAGIALALAALFALHTTRRLLAPRADVSWLAQVSERRDLPRRPKAVQVSGLIADYPQRSEFNARFPLEVEQVNGRGATGRVWVAAPLGSPLGIGDRIAFRAQLRPLPRPGNPGERAMFWPQIIAGCWCGSAEVQNLQIVEVGASFSFERRVQWVRRAILTRYETLFAGTSPDANTLAKRPFPRQNAALLTAMVWGENGLSQPLPDTTRADFRAAGLSHLLVASGTQVTFIFGALLLLSRALGVKRGWIIAFVLPGLIAYTMLAGAAPSIWRATAFGLLAAFCLASGRDLDALSLWGAALLGLLVLDPALAWSLSLQLTFAAVWGLLCLAPVFFRLVKRLNDGAVGQLAAMSLGAQSATIPLSLLHFGTASAAGVGANFIAIPLAGVLVFAGALGLILPLGEPLYLLTRSVGDLAQNAAHPMGAQVRGLSLPLGWSLGCYALLIVMALPFAEEWPELRASLLAFVERKRAAVAHWNPRVVCGLLGTVALGLTAWNFAPARGPFRVTVLDVGQGSCVLVQEPGGRAALVDGGSLEGAHRADIGTSVIVPALRELGVERLDYVFLTHPDAEHCNGLVRVLSEIPVGAFVDGAQAGQKKRDALSDLLGGQADLDELRREVARRGVPRLLPSRGQLYPLGEAKLRVLGPDSPLLASQNDNSLVVRAEWNRRTVLLAGDLEREGEKRLVRRGEPVRCDVLLVSRHGASTSSSSELLSATAPGAAIVSCGRYNRFGFPSPRVLDAFARRKVPLFRTDLDGALSIECDQSACRITPQNP